MRMLEDGLELGPVTLRESFPKCGLHAGARNAGHRREAI